MHLNNLIVIVSAVIVQIGEMSAHLYFCRKKTPQKLIILQIHITSIYNIFKTINQVIKINKVRINFIQILKNKPNSKLLASRNTENVFTKTDPLSDRQKTLELINKLYKQQSL